MLLAYTLCFYVAAYKIVYPYEYENSFETHPIRPIYNVIFYPLRWVKANGMSFKSTGIEERYGWLTPDVSDSESDSRSALVENIDGPSASIGFTGNEELLKEFDKLEKGQYVMLAFGVALDKKWDRFINKLVSYKKINLPPDPRIKADDVSNQESEELLSKHNNLTGEAKNCAEEFIKNYQQKVLEHCLLAGYANNIGGGCYHIVGYSVNTGVVKKALNECNIET
jgi:hypothetical protein